MIVAVGSLHREAVGIIRSGGYVAIEAPEDFMAFRPPTSDTSTVEETRSITLPLPVIVLSGSGTERSARATEWAIENFSPTAIISFGFCGATRDHQVSGDIVIAARVVNLPGTPFDWSMVDIDESLGPDRTLRLAARTAVEVSGMDYHHGTIATASRITKTSGMKRWLGQSINATAVDTQTHAVATVASTAGIPWVSVLSVLDAWDFNLPKIVDRTGSGPLQRGVTAYINHLSKYPLTLPSLMRLGRSSRRASASLTIFMTAFMEAYSALTNEDQTADTT